IASGALVGVIVAALGTLVGPGCRRPPHARRADDALVAAPAPPSLDGGPGDPPGAAALGPPLETLTRPPLVLAASVRLAVFARGLDRPVALVAAPGDPHGRLYVVEQRHGIRALDDGKAGGYVLDLTGTLSTGNEQGVLGLAFHPRFADNHRLYVDYTDKGGDTHVVEYVLEPRTGTVDAASAREVFSIDQPYSNHNGGNLVFGPDGRLWIGLGDGGSANDPHGNGQNDRVLLAKLLRLDVDTPGARPEIVAKGLRNPWRYSFDAATGDLYLGDVGQDLWESIYVVPADHLLGHDFGWNVVEGRHCFHAERCDRSGFTPPVADYGHDAGCSVTGGFVYRGKALPALTGRYFYADFCTAFVRSFRWAPDGIRDHWDWKAALDPDGTLNQLSSFGVDADGELYLLSLDGTVFRFEPRR
ncbi:MAG TPA: PQQ-dependent sugar dehydrogenase, partial [Kofleriaceae bacterium]|nr:PQQ-dependent sugar dehydrogenase [Kofleriaceae bacterium]